MAEVLIYDKDLNCMKWVSATDIRGFSLTGEHIYWNGERLTRYTVKRKLFWFIEVTVLGHLREDEIRDESNEKPNNEISF